MFVVEPLLQASVGLSQFVSEAKKIVQKCRGIEDFGFRFDEENKHPKAGKKWSKGALCCTRHTVSLVSLPLPSRAREGRPQRISARCYSCSSTFRSGCPGKST